MYLTSRVAQNITIAGRTFQFAADERLHTENSHKFTVEGFLDLAGQAGWRSQRYWVSPAPEFAIFCLSAC
jgi:uncharacterized SAM-dependent methyltransferase